MKIKILLPFLILLFFGINAEKTFASDFSNEKLHYKVMYKWGLIHKQAGTATLSLTNNGNKYDMLLTAASDPWADKFFMVRDTLIGSMYKSNMNPIVYKKMSHEGGDRKHDEVYYTISGNSVVGKCTRKKWDKKGKLTINEARTLTAEGKTLDMLSSFYFMRNLPYSTWKPGETVSINLFSGKRKEILTIKYKGVETIEIDGKSHRTYHITFRFYDPTKSKKETDAPMDAWLSTDSRCVPLKLEGQLTVGKVQCFYTGG